MGEKRCWRTGDAGPRPRDRERASRRGLPRGPGDGGRKKANLIFETCRSCCFFFKLLSDERCNENEMFLVQPWDWTHAINDFWIEYSQNIFEENEKKNDKVKDKIYIRQGRINQSINQSIYLYPRKKTPDKGKKKRPEDELTWIYYVQPIGDRHKLEIIPFHYHCMYVCMVLYVCTYTYMI